MVMPAPIQSRAYATVRDAIHAAAALIEEHGEDSVRILDVVGRSGVSAGSLTHHFGSREGLIAAALMELFDRAGQQRARSFKLDATDPVQFANGLAAVVGSAAAGERDAARLARIRALAYARRRPELRAAVIESVTSLAQGISAVVAASPSRSALGSEVSSLALLVFTESYSAGRFVDMTFGDKLPMQDWAALFARIVRAFAPDDIMDAALGVLPESASSWSEAPEPDGAFALRPEERPAIPRLDLDDDERRVLEVAIELERTQGAQAIRVHILVALTGLSRSWFARHLGEREDILDAIHLANLVAFAEVECMLLEEAFDEAHDSEDLGRRLDDVVETMSKQASVSGAWNRLQLIATASGRPELAAQAAPIVHGALARTSAAIAGAKQRGLVYADVPPRALARLLWAAPLAFVLGEVVGVEWRELHLLGQRTSRTWIVPEVSAPPAGRELASA